MYGKWDFYDEDYYQHGIETAKSNYQNYRWLPEMTMSLAMTMIDCLDIKRHHRVLDFGCALGFLVKAFRLLHREAWGIDASVYAINNADPAVIAYCRHPAQLHGLPNKFDFCIAKDVFEHMVIDEAEGLLANFFLSSVRTMFVVVPLGKNGRYVAPANNLDKSHRICEDLHWWNKLFVKTGWAIQEETYKIEGIKDAYYEKYPESHGFFILRRP
jgi:SAM-dependent methyltransferase